jgi:hypothetical protein
LARKLDQRRCTIAAYASTDQPRNGLSDPTASAVLWADEAPFVCSATSDLFLNGLPFGNQLKCFTGCWRRPGHCQFIEAAPDVGPAERKPDVVASGELFIIDDYNFCGWPIYSECVFDRARDKLSAIEVTYNNRKPQVHLSTLLRKGKSDSATGRNCDRLVVWIFRYPVFAGSIKPRRIGSSHEFCRYRAARI